MIIPFSTSNPLLNVSNILNFNSSLALDVFKKSSSDQSTNKISNQIFQEIPTNSLENDFKVFNYFSNKSYTSLSELENLLNVLPEGLFGEIMHTSLDISLSKMMHNQMSINSVFDLSRNRFLLPLAFSFSNPTTSLVIGIEYPLNLYLSSKLDLSSRLLTRVATDALFLSAQLFHSALAIQNGCRYEKKSSIIKHAFMGLAGVYGALSTLIQADYLFRGSHQFSTLDEYQQNAVLKYRAVHLIAKEKPCNAVIIDEELCNNLKKGTPLPMGELLYENCHTRAYAVNSEETFCNALQKAKNYFNTSIDKLILHGTADRSSITLGKDYNFTATDYTLKCLDQTLKSNAEIFALGSNTATQDQDPLSKTPSIAERMSNYLSNRKVTGLEAYFNQFLTLQEFKNGALSFNAFGYTDSNGDWVLGNSAVTFQNSREVN